MARGSKKPCLVDSRQSFVQFHHVILLDVTAKYRGICHVALCLRYLQLAHIFDLVCGFLFDDLYLFIYLITCKFLSFFLILVSSQADVSTPIICAPLIPW